MAGALVVQNIIMQPRDAADRAEVNMQTDNAGCARLRAAALAAVIILGGLAPSAYATPPGSDLPEIRAYGPVTYVSGGIDDREILALRAAEPAYPLALEFAETGRNDGDYLSGVVVDIRDAAGNVVLSAIADGPLLLADLPAGAYVVTAGLRGAGQQRDVVVGSRATVHLYFFW
jgi:hypothetical protein